MRSAKGEAAMLSKAVRQAIARSRRSMVETRDPPLVHERALAAHRPVELALRGHVAGAEDDLAVHLEADEVAPGRQAAHEVARPVDRVHDPAPAAPPRVARPLLAEEAVLGEGRAQLRDDEPLALPVGDRHRRVVRLVLALDAPRRVLQRQLARAPGHVPAHLDLAFPGHAGILPPKATFGRLPTEALDGVAPAVRRPARLAHAAAGPLRQRVAEVLAGLLGEGLKPRDHVGVGRGHVGRLADVGHEVVEGERHVRLPVLPGDPARARRSRRGSASGGGGRACSGRPAGPAARCRSRRGAPRGASARPPRRGGAARCRGRRSAARGAARRRSARSSGGRRSSWPARGRPSRPGCAPASGPRRARARRPRTPCPCPRAAAPPSPRGRRTRATGRCRRRRSRACRARARGGGAPPAPGPPSRRSPRPRRRRGPASSVRGSARTRRSARAASCGRGRRRRGARGSPR